MKGLIPWIVEEREKTVFRSDEYKIWSERLEAVKRLHNLVKSLYIVPIAKDMVAPDVLYHEARSGIQFDSLKQAKSYIRDLLKMLEDEE